MGVKMICKHFAHFWMWFESSVAVSFHLCQSSLVWGPQPSVMWHHVTGRVPMFWRIIVSLFSRLKGPRRKLHMKIWKQSWGRQFAYHVISYHFVGTSHRGSKQWIKMRQA